MTDLSLEGFRTFVNAQPDDREVQYRNPCGCAWAQYAQSQGHEDINVGSVQYAVGPRPRDWVPLPAPLQATDTYDDDTSPLNVPTFKELKDVLSRI